MQRGPQAADLAMAPRAPADVARTGTAPRMLFAAIGICAAAGVLLAGLMSPAVADWPSLLKYSSLILLLCAATGLWMATDTASQAAPGQEGAEPAMERAMRVAAALDRDGEAIAAIAADLAHEDEDARARLAVVSGASRIRAEAISRLTDQAETLATEFRARGADLVRASAIASRMADTAREAQNSIASIAGRVLDLSNTAEAAERALPRGAGAGGQASAGEAAASLASIARTIDAMRVEADQAICRLAQLSDLTESQHAFVARLEAATQAQAALVTALLTNMRASDGAEAGIRADQETLLGHQARRDHGFAVLRKTALRLPEYADAVAQLFRDMAEGQQS